VDAAESMINAPSFTARTDALSLAECDLVAYAWEIRHG
jgi:hypothetical protein